MNASASTFKKSFASPDKLPMVSNCCGYARFKSFIPFMAVCVCVLLHHPH